jgi:hypothetical protein
MRSRIGSSPLALVALAVALASAGGCVREVVSGEDPRSHAGRVTGSDQRDSLVVRLPWLEAAPPRMLFEDRLLAYETVFSRLNDGTARYVLRSLNSVVATVDVRSALKDDGAMEFEYRLGALPAGYASDVVFDLRPRPAVPPFDLWTNGAPVKVAPDTEVVSVLLSRDAPTRITARARNQAAAGTKP